MLSSSVFPPLPSTIADGGVSHQTQAIDDVFRHTIASTDPIYTKEGKKIVERLAKLKYEMQHDRLVT